ncbi:hypothetical protein FRC10_010938 [Ceratobasidium sp. 414]|nr:hypothetical protein FRC10_010938 [Ceratobasidium sp. 414]
MPRELEPPNIQGEFVLAALRASPPIRADGRSPMQAREPELIFGDELGSVECRMGKTRALANVSASMARPRADRPYEGSITIHTELSPMASAIYETGRSSEEEVALTRLIEKIIRRSEAVDREALCILAGQQTKEIFLTVRAWRLWLRYDILDEDLPVLDPSHLETQLSQSSLNLALTPAREICTVQKAGGLALGADDMLRLVDLAARRAKELSAFVEKRLKEDLSSRVIEIR